MDDNTASGNGPLRAKKAPKRIIVIRQWRLFNVIFISLIICMKGDDLFIKWGAAASELRQARFVFPEFSSKLGLENPGKSSSANGFSPRVRGSDDRHRS